jgi:predicted secreted protein
MPIGSIIAIFFVVWWVVLFAVLPWGVRTQQEEGEVVLGTDPGAPANPRLLRKAITTTTVAAIVTSLIWMLFGHYGVGVKEIADWLDGRLK